jgi:hypothetical protein
VRPILVVGVMTIGLFGSCHNRNGTGFGSQANQSHHIQARRTRRHGYRLPIDDDSRRGQ